MFTFEKLSLGDLAALCGGVRESARAAESMEDAATSVVRFLRRSFVTPGTGQPEIALARAFQTASLETLPDDLRDYADARWRGQMDGASRYLALMGTDGDLEEWRDRHQSLEYRALPLPSEEAAAAAPMVSSLIEQLGVSLDDVLAGDGHVHGVKEKDFGVFFVQDAVGSARVPAQEFVASHGIRSVLGFGGLLPGGDIFAVILFIRHPVSEAVAQLFRAVAIATKVALLSALEAPLFRGQPSRPKDTLAMAVAKTQALEQLLDVQQKTVVAQATHLERLLATTETLQDVTTTLSAELELDRLVQAATDAATRVTGAAFGAFFYNVVNNNGESYMLYSLSGVPRERFAHFPMPRNTEVFDPTFRGTEVIRSHDITKDERYGHNEPHHGIPAGHLPVRSYLAVPVVARSGEVHGGFFFGHPEVGVFDEPAERLALGIAAQTAIALDNARLFQAERNIALELQRSLLPQDISVPDGLELAYEYLAGGGGADVGGDWFDVIPLSGSRTAFVVGDVMGRGVKAAAVMGQIRTAIRAYSVMDLSPSDLVTRLNVLVCGMDDDLIVTCIVAVLDRGDDTLTIANAGHLPPAISRPDGRTMLLDISLGPPLGVPGAMHGEYRLDFQAGTRMLLFTDGLVEHRDRSLGTGLELLCDQLRDLKGDPAVVSKALIGALVDAQTQDDDVTLLVVGNTGLSRHDQATREFPSDAASASTTRTFVEAVLVQWGDQALTERVTASVNELFANAVEHARSPVTLRLRRLPSVIVAEVEDLDTHLPRRTHATPDDEHHRGLQIVEALASRWGARPTDSGKVVWVEFDESDSSERGTPVG